MAYYDSLITAWTNASKPTGATLPTGVTGGLLTGLTTAQKLTAINGWTLIVAKPAFLTPSKILNACVAADLLSLTAAQLTLMQLLLQDSSVDCSAGTAIRAVFQSIFAGKTTTLSQLSTLVGAFDNATFPWWQATTAQGGAALNSPIGVGDLSATGLT